MVNTDDLGAVIAASPVDLGEVIELSRGDLSWRLTVPRDGSLAEGEEKGLSFVVSKPDGTVIEIS